MKRLAIKAVALLLALAVFALPSVKLASAGVAPEVIIIPTVESPEAPGIEWVKEFSGSSIMLVHKNSDGGYTVICKKLNICIIKTDSQGNVIQEISVPYTGNCGFRIAKQVSDGGYIIVGNKDATKIGYKYGCCLLYLVKVDSAGNIQWEKSFGEQGSGIYQYGHDVIETSDGGFIAVGIKYKWSGSSHRDVYLVKVNSNGDSCWSKTWITNDKDEWMYAIERAPSCDGYIIGGADYGSTYLIKIDDNGNMLWEKKYEDDGSFTIYSLKQTFDGNLIALGVTKYGSNAAVAKIDGLGNILWEKVYTGDNIPSYRSSSIAIHLTSDGGYIFNTSAGSSYGGTCIFKIDEYGELQWHKMMDGLYFQILETDDGGYIAAGGYRMAKLTFNYALSIVVEPSSVGLLSGRTQQLNVIVYHLDGSTEDVTEQASYQSENSFIATVSSTGLITGVSPGTVNITVTYQGKTVTVPVIVSDPIVDSITVQPDIVCLNPGGTQQLTVTAHLSDGNDQEVTDQASYQSDNASVAAVSSSGMITAVSPGTANITVTYEDKTAIVPVTVSEASTVLPQGDIIVLRTPEFLQPVTYNCAAGFTVTENGIDVPVIKVEVKDGTDGWPYSEIWLYLAHPVTMGSDVVVEYNADPDHPITPVDGGTVTVPVTTTVNHSTVPFTIERSTVYIPSSGDVVYVDLPTAVNSVDYQGNAGFVIHTGTVTIPVTRVVTEGTQVRLYPVYRIPEGEPVSITYTPVSGYEITTVTGAPLVVTENPVTIINESQAPLVYYDPVVSGNGRTVTLTVPADLGSVVYEGNAGFRVFANGQEIPVVGVEIDGNKIVLYLGAPLIGGQSVSVSYQPVPDSPIVTPGGGSLGGSDNVPAENPSQVSVISITVDASELNLAPGESRQITVTAHYSDGSTADVTGLASYQSDKDSVATVSLTGLVTAVAPGSAIITITYEGKSITVPVTVVAVLETITVEPASVSVPTGKTQQLIVIAHYSDGSTKDVTNQASYQSDNVSVAVVNSNGLVTGVSQGSAAISVAYGGKNVSVPVTVTAPAVESISVQPASVSVPAGRTQQLAVTAYYSDGSSRDVTGASLYQSENASIASVSESGLVTGIAEGTTTVIVTYEGKTATVPVSVSAPVVESLTVEPDPVNLPAGRTQQLTVTAHYSDGSTRDVTGQAGYQSNNASVASVSEGGLVTGLSEGSATVTVAYSDVFATVPVSVSAAVLDSIKVEPESVNIPAGKTQQLAVTAHYSDGSIRDVTNQASYQSENASVAAVSATGLVKGVAQGTANVNVLFGGKSAIVPVVVSAAELESISVEPASVNIPAGKTQQITVVAYYSDGSRVDVTNQAHYQSDNGAVASVSETGLVTGVVQGSAAVTVTFGNKSVSIPVTIGSPVVEFISVGPVSINIPAGRTQQITVTAHYSDGSIRDITDQASYQSDDASVATVSSNGLVTGVSQGSTNITVSYEGKTAVVPVKVGAPVVESISVQPASVNLVTGKTQQLTVTVYYSDGSSRDVTNEASYLSGNASVATVSSYGLVTGESQGNTDISVSFEGRTATVPVTVSAPTVESISVEPALVNIPAGRTQQLRVIARYSDGSTVDVTGQASYKSENNSIATVSGAGLIKGVLEGSTNVVVSYEGKTATVPVVVEEAELESIAVEPVSVSLPAGRIQQLTVTAVYSDGSTKDVTNQVSYQSDNASVAVVSGSGLVTGKSQGIANITATYEGKTASVPVTVTAPVLERISVSPEQLNIAAGKTGQLAVTAFYSDGTTKDVTNQASYQPDDPSVADVSVTGLVTGKKQGSTKVIVSFGGLTAISRVLVSEAVLESISVDPASVNLIAGKTQQLTVKATYSDGTVKDVTTSSSYRTSSRSVAMVSETGGVKGVSKGSAEITVTFGGKSVSVPVTVSAPVVESVQIQPNPLKIYKTNSQRLRVLETYSDGSTRDVTLYAAFSSSNASVVRVNSTGLVTGIREGSASVRVTYKGKTYEVLAEVLPVEVIPPPGR